MFFQDLLDQKSLKVLKGFWFATDHTQWSQIQLFHSEIQPFLKLRILFWVLRTLKFANFLNTISKCASMYCSSILDPVKYNASNHILIILITAILICYQSFVEEKTAMKLCNSCNFFRNKTVLFVKIESWNFARFHEILYDKDAENFSFLFWQTKKESAII